MKFNFEGNLVDYCATKKEIEGIYVYTHKNEKKMRQCVLKPIPPKTYKFSGVADKFITTWTNLNIFWLMLHCVLAYVALAYLA